MTEHVARQANERDLTELARLYAAWNDEEDDDKPAGVDPLFEQRFRAWYTEESIRRIIWLAEVTGRPAGFVDLAIVVRPPTPRRAAICWGYLDSAFVLEPYRNQGFGTMLLNAVLDDARQQNITRILLYPTTKAVPFYQRAGFKVLPADSKIRMVMTTARAGADQPLPDTLDLDLTDRARTERAPWHH